jgi:hypothetical protein
LGRNHVCPKVQTYLGVLKCKGLAEKAWRGQGYVK